MRTPTRTRIAAAVAGLPAVIALATLAACSQASGTTASGPTAHRNADYENITAIVACYRQHGDPGFPDPVYDPSDGNWHFGISPGTAPESTQQACQHLFPSGDQSPPVPQPQFQALVRLAACIRQHGEPSWPDPNQAGQFPLPPSLAKSPTEERAMTACQRDVPSGGIDVVAAP